MISAARKDAFSVIVVGAGPGGSVLAYELAQRGIDVAILERERLPRYKLCGGGITLKSAKQLPFDIGPVVHRTFDTVTLLHNGQEKLVLHHSKPLLYTSMRDEFDYFLTQRAVEKGATLLDGHPVVNIQEVDGHFELVTPKGHFQSQVVVGADGANSIVARIFQLRVNPFWGLGLEAEIPYDSQLLKWSDSIYVDLGGIRHGYAWIFPKRDHASIGVAAPAALSKELREYYERFVSKYAGTDKLQKKPQGHYLPLRKWNMPIQHGKVLLIGDAAGLIEPFLGEGIYYAIRSGQIAATEIAGVLARTKPDFSDYQKIIDATLMPELASAQLLSGLLTKFTSFAIFFLSSSKTQQRHFCEAVSGDKKLSDAGRVLGPFKFMFDFAGRIAMLDNRLNIFAGVEPSKLSMRKAE